MARTIVLWDLFISQRLIKAQKNHFFDTNLTRRSCNTVCTRHRQTKGTSHWGHTSAQSDHNLQFSLNRLHDPEIAQVDNKVVTDFTQCWSDPSLFVFSSHFTVFRIVRHWKLCVKARSYTSCRILRKPHYKKMYPVTFATNTLWDSDSWIHPRSTSWNRR